MALVTEVGNGSNTLFWKDRWLNGKEIKDPAPNFYSEAFLNMRWISYFRGALSVTVLLEYVLFQQVEQVIL
jgi:hypothetical protein